MLRVGGASTGVFVVCVLSFILEAQGVWKAYVEDRGVGVLAVYMYIVGRHSMTKD